MKEFHQISEDGLCRFDAICNAAGKSLLTLKQFYQKCDEFDEIHDYDKGFTREFFGVVDESYDNIFNYILSNTGKYKTKYVDDTFTDDHIITPQDLEGCYSVILFNSDHVWAVRRSLKNPDIWVELDSHIQLRYIHPGKTMSFKGAILVYKTDDIKPQQVNKKAKNKKKSKKSS